MTKTSQVTEVIKRVESGRTSSEDSDDFETRLEAVEEAVVRIEQ